MEQGGHSSKTGCRQSQWLPRRTGCRPVHSRGIRSKQQGKHNVVGKSEAWRIHHMLSQHLVHLTRPLVQSKRAPHRLTQPKGHMQPSKHPSGNFRVALLECKLCGPCHGPLCPHPRQARQGPVASGYNCKLCLPTWEGGASKEKPSNQAHGGREPLKNVFWICKKMAVVEML